jgi:heme exporter protein C
MLKWILAVAMGASIVGSFFVPDLATFQNPALARIVFYHVPCAILSTLFLLFGAYLSARYLKGRDMGMDVRALAAMEMGFVLALLAMATGILFSKVQWGAWWHWDPRQTSFLLVLLIFAAYFALRSAFSDEAQRAAIAAAYALISVLPVLFFVFVFPRLDQVQSLHPSSTIAQGQLGPDYRLVLYSVFFLLLAFCGWLYRMASRAGDLELRKTYGKLDSGGHPAPTGVVRPVSLRKKD